MMTRANLKRLSDEDIEQYLTLDREGLALTERRLTALRKTRAAKPTWSALDPYVGEEVGIDIRVEEQEAVRDEFATLISLLTDELDRRRGLNQTMRML